MSVFFGRPPCPGPRVEYLKEWKDVYTIHVVTSKRCKV